MSQLNREKRGHFNILRSASHVEADLSLLKEIDPSNTLVKSPGSGQRFADDVLIALLMLTARCDIVDYRRGFAKRKLLVAQSSTLKERFAAYLGENTSAFPLSSAEEVEKFVMDIAGDLILKVTADIADLIGAQPEEIELHGNDNEHFFIRLTSDAVKIRQEAETARLAQEAETARLAQEAETARLAQEVETARLAQEAEAARLAQGAEAARLAQEAEELEEQESGIDAKEAELEAKAEELEEKESGVRAKETALSSDDDTEKKSTSKKKSTPK